MNGIPQACSSPLHRHIDAITSNPVLRYSTTIPHFHRHFNRQIYNPIEAKSVCVCIAMIITNLFYPSLHLITWMSAVTAHPEPAQQRALFLQNIELNQWETAYAGIEPEVLDDYFKTSVDAVSTATASMGTILLDMDPTDPAWGAWVDIDLPPGSKSVRQLFHLIKYSNLAILKQIKMLPRILLAPDYLLDKIDDDYLQSVPSDYHNGGNSQHEGGGDGNSQQEYEGLINTVVVLYAMNQKMLQVVDQQPAIRRVEKKERKKRLEFYDKIITELYRCIVRIIVDNNTCNGWFLDKFERLNTEIAVSISQQPRTYMDPKFHSIVKRFSSLILSATAAFGDRGVEPPSYEPPTPGHSALSEVLDKFIPIRFVVNLDLEPNFEDAQEVKMLLESLFGILHRPGSVFQSWGELWSKIRMMVTTLDHW